ncbi:MAG: RNA-binding protein [Firmicutes bacterium]|nr:RNA-binding protein [Bacillota bacterium]
MNIYVGNLPREVNEEELQQEFAAFGEVASAAIIKDKFTHESKGFGFVEMPAKAEAEAAITALNGKDIKGRNITVSEARPRSDDRSRRPGGGGGGRGPGGRGGGGGGRRW